MAFIIQTRTQKAVANRHPDTIPHFQQGLEAVFRMWTALELALFHQWGGSNGSNVATELQEEVMAMFLAPERVYKDDVSLVLEDYMETYFQIILEDGSADEIGELLCVLWRKCAEGDFSMKEGILEQERRRTSAVSTSQGLDGGGDEMDSDDEVEGAVEFGDNQARMAEGLQDNTVFTKMGGGVGSAGGTGMDKMMEDEQEEEAPSLVDADGFELVVVGQKKKKGKAKRGQGQG